jgi:16S rRNA (guanine966-N2)-methyltransferase
MRIISGRFKGRIIKRPRGIRPTQDKVRKALFDILGDIRGLAFLELYAGSGAIGLEALSQGAGKVVFVEKDRRCIKQIKQNISVIGFLGYRVIGLDVPQALKQLNKRDEKFDIIFLDPPYYRDLAKKTLKTLSRYDIVSPNGLIICEHFKKDSLPEVINNLRLVKQAQYGDTVLSFYRLRDEFQAK